MVSGYNICYRCKGKIDLSSRKGNHQESKIMGLCIGCYKISLIRRQEEIKRGI